MSFERNRNTCPDTVRADVGNATSRPGHIRRTESVVRRHCCYGERAIPRARASLSILITAIMKKGILYIWKYLKSFYYFKLNTFEPWALGLGCLFLVWTVCVLVLVILLALFGGSIQDARCHLVAPNMASLIEGVYIFA